MIEGRPAEEDPARTAALLRAIGAATPDLIYAKDRGSRFIYANAATVALLGHPIEAIMGRSNLDLFRDSAEARTVMESDDRIMASGQAVVLEEVFTGPDGVTRYFRSAKSPMRNAEGEVIGLAGVSTDITDRRRRESALAETEQRFRLALKATNDAIWDWDLAANSVRWNEALEAAYGHPLAEVEPTGDWWIGHIHPDDRARIDASIHAVIDGTGETWRDEYRFLRADGSYAEVIDRGTVLRGEDGRASRMIGAMLDVSGLRRVEERLRDSESRMRLAAEAARIGTWDFDPVTGELRWDAECKALFGLPPDAEVSYETAFLAGLHPDDREPTHAAVSAALAPNGSGTYSVEYRTIGLTDGVLRWASATGRAVFEGDRAVRFLGTIHDITERKAAEQALRELNETLERRVEEEVAERAKAEEALRQSQKMEAVGQLTGGIAHDFNNLLTVVIGNIDIGRRVLDSQREGAADRLRRALDNAQRGAERAAALTQRLLAFARRQPLDPKSVDIGALLESMSDLIDRAVGETIRLRTAAAPDLWRTEVDPNQLEATILNLVVNARDAMPDGGTLTIETTNVSFDDTLSAARAGVTPGSYVLVAVTDTGIGMSEELLGRVFEPFFTTKEVGKGTGLGLSQVYGFVKQSGGHVRVYSEEGVGTAVRLYLPRLSGDVAEEIAAPELAVADGHAGETILVVEDDDDVRGYTVEVLRGLGYRVLEAHDGASGLRLLERSDQPIHLLFTDVVMPGLSGRELAERARAARPELPVLYTSGYTRDAIVSGGRLDAGIELIGKPFTRDALARKVREMLDRRG